MHGEGAMTIPLSVVCNCNARALTWFHHHLILLWDDGDLIL